MGGIQWIWKRERMSVCRMSHSLGVLVWLLASVSVDVLVFAKWQRLSRHIPRVMSHAK